MVTPRTTSAAPQTTAAPLTLRLFGPMQVLIHGQLPPPLHSRKSLWLLALLALRHDRSVEREWLAATLWPDSGPGVSAASLRNNLSALRTGLGDQAPRIQRPSRHTLLLDLSGADVDLLAFDAAVHSPHRNDLERAVALYRGPLLEGCNEEWVLAERSARANHCLQALQRLGESALTQGDAESAGVFFARAVGMNPWSDAARRGWMESLSRNGDTNAALQVYREFVQLLRSDPTASPDKETSALYQRLRAQPRQRAAGSPSPGAIVPRAPDGTAVPRVRGYLPHPLTELVGREDERREVAQLLRHSRLVSLTGLGGIGKTRLAREVAGEVIREYADGVWLVAMESLTEGRLVARQIASVLGLTEASGQSPLQRVTDYLRGKRLLLVLDNCEHLLQACAEVVAHLLRECAGVRILATSREPLGIAGEAVWSVPALAVPDLDRLPQGPAVLPQALMGYASVRLFVERAEAVRKDFTLSVGNARAVAQACQQLEGIPLAIELAAARARAMTAAQIASHLENHLRLLTGGSRPAQPRQQTLRAMLDWSYALLGEAERLLLKRLSVFAGGWTLEAAEAVCRDGTDKGETLGLLSSLVDKSLVVFRDQETGGRYRLLEMVRQYAAEALEASGTAVSLRTRHRNWFLSLAEEAEPQLRRGEQVNWLQRLESDHDNLRVALAWCEPEEDPRSEAALRGVQAGLRLAGALWRFWYVRGEFSEGRASLERALAREGAQDATLVRAKALNGAGALARRQGDYASARPLNEEALTIQRALEDAAGIATSLNNLGDVAYYQGQFETAHTLYAESLAIRRERADKDGIGDSVASLGLVAHARHDYEASRTLYEDSLALRRELGDLGGVANCLLSLGTLALAQGDFDTAWALMEENLVIRRELGDLGGIAHTLRNLGSVAYDRGDLETARTLYEESLVRRRELGDRFGIADSLSSLSLVAGARGDIEAVRALEEEVLALRRELGDKGRLVTTLYWLGCHAQTLRDYEAARTYLLESVALYRELGHPDALQALGRLAHLVRDMGDDAQAHALYRESLRLRQERGDTYAIAQALEDLAVFAGRHGEFERAVRLLGAAEVLCESVGRKLSCAVPPDYEVLVAAARTALGEETFTAAWSEGRTMTQEQAVAYALGEAAEEAIC